MITILSGKMTIPENDRFVGFAGDNLVITKQFFIKDIVDENYIYRLYLSFDDNTYNYLQLDKTVGEDGTMLTWNVKSDDIFKSGVVMAQIKFFSTSDEIFHTTTDYFIVAPSAEFTDSFADKENSEFLDYENYLNSLLEEINDAKQYLPYVDQDGYWHVFDSEKGEYKKTEISAGLEDYFVIDSELSSTSTNPVENKAVYEALSDLEENKADIDEVYTCNEADELFVNNSTYQRNTGHGIRLGLNNSTYAISVWLENSSGGTLSQSGVTLPLGTMVVGGSYNSTNKSIVLTLKNGSTISFSIADLISGLESASNKVTTISSASTNTQYPSAKAVYDYLQSLNGNGVSY